MAILPSAKTIDDPPSSLSLTVDVPVQHEIGEVSALFETILTGLPYYNAVAKATEMAKYRPESIASAIATDPQFTLVARLEGVLAGFCFSQKDDGLIWLAWFGVAAAYRRQGVGTAILEALVKRSLSSGSHKIWCDSRTSNTPSRSLLEKCGFRAICTVANHWYGQDFILWERFVA